MFTHPFFDDFDAHLSESTSSRQRSRFVALLCLLLAMIVTALAPSQSLPAPMTSDMSSPVR